MSDDARLGAMGTVWIVESGELDTRTIEGVFSTKAQAEAYIAQVKQREAAAIGTGYGGPAYAIDDAPSEWPLDPEPPNE